MSQDEITAIVKSKQDGDRTSWEQTRTICFYNYITQNGTKNIKQPSDLFKLQWDGKEDKTKGKTLTKDEFLNRAKLIK